MQHYSCIKLQFIQSVCYKEYRTQSYIEHLGVTLIVSKMLQQMFLLNDKFVKNLLPNSNKTAKDIVFGDTFAAREVRR